MLAAVVAVALFAVALAVAVTVVIFVVVVVFVDATPFAAILALVFTFDSHSMRVTSSCNRFHCERFTLVNRITMRSCCSNSVSSVAHRLTPPPTSHSPHSCLPLWQATGRLLPCAFTKKRLMAVPELQLQLLLLPLCNGNIAVVVAVAVISISVVVAAGGAEYVAGVAYLAGPVPKSFSLALPRLAEIN